jgi:dipeptidyl aminopeptidase/acylaminoacyl peptidase
MRPMRAWIATAVLAWAGLAAGAGDTTTSAAGPDSKALEEAVARMARIGSSYGPALSPDSKQVAYISNLSGVFQVWIIPTDGGHPKLVTAFDDPVGSVAWSRDGQWLAFDVLPGGGLNAQVYLARPDGSDVRRITAGGEVNNGLGAFTDNGRWLTYTSNERDPAATDPYLYELATGRATRVLEGAGITSISDVSRDGTHALVFRLRSRGSNDLYLRDLASGEERELTTHRGPGTFFGDIAPDGRTVYLSSNKDRDLIAFARIDVSRPKRPGKIEVLAARDDAELWSFVLDEAGERAVLIWNASGRSEIELYHIADGKRSPLPAPPGELLGEFVFTRDGTRAVVRLQGAAQPNDLWVLDFATGKYRQLTFSPHAGVAPDTLVRPELRTFKAHDGVPLSGWLYLPRDYRKLGPVVLSFHGGPEGQERPAFRSDYQALLAQGIAVFAPNIRGSAGFGKKFVSLDNGELRFDANRDVKTCAEYLVQGGIADAKRIGIMGGSYGGYVVMMALTEYPDTFAAGANLYGIVNFETFFSHTQPWMAAISTIEYGDPNTQADLLRRLSPIHRIDRIKAPTLVLHGANDTNVPVVEAEQVVANLKQRNVPVDYVLFPDEGHGWRKTANRIRSTVETTRFFTRHLKP